MGNGCLKPVIAETGERLREEKVGANPETRRTSNDARPSISSRVLVATDAAFGDGGRGARIVRARGREVAVWKHKGEYYALDNACYHHGASLAPGEIEELDGRACIVCPWHGYRITLKEGEGLYWGFSGDIAARRRSTKPLLKSKGCKQRAHTVVLDAEQVYLEINEDKEPRESDRYCSGAVESGGGGSVHSTISDVTGGPPRLCTVRVVRKELASTSGKSILVELQWDAGVMNEPSPGQFAEVRIPSAGVTRKWTITACPSPNSLVLIIKHKPGGIASTYVAEKLQEGDTVHVLGIGGNFGLVKSPLADKTSDVLLLCGGIGVTPMLAILDAFLSDGSPYTGSVVLYYGERSTDDVVAFSTLRKHAMHPRACIHLCFTGQASQTETFHPINVLHQRVDFFSVAAAYPLPRPTYICGPGTFRTEAATALPYPGSFLYTEEFD